MTNGEETCEDPGNLCNECDTDNDYFKLDRT